jgi:hypothetical protein
MNPNKPPLGFDPIDGLRQVPAHQLPGFLRHAGVPEPSAAARERAKRVREERAKRGDA